MLWAVFGGGTGINYPAGGNPDQWTAIAQEQLRTNNPLFSYAPSPGVYQCAGDTRFKYQTTLADGWCYGSYSRSQNTGGDPWNSFMGINSAYTKSSNIKAASSTFIFVEDADTKGSGYNRGTWSVNWSVSAKFGHGQSFSQWWDPVPMYHGDVSTFGFADGHSESHKWHDSELIQAGLSAAKGKSVTVNATAGVDYDYVYNGYRFPGWKE